MQNRFLEMRQSLAELDRLRAEGRHVPYFAAASSLGALPGRSSRRRLSFSATSASAQRVLVVLIENGGVDLGVGQLVDKLLDVLPGTSLIPRSVKDVLVRRVEQAVLKITDDLLESAELMINGYESAKPEHYGDVVVLRNDTAFYANLRDTLVRLTAAEKVIDLLVLTHGGEGFIALGGGGRVDSDMIRAIRTLHNGNKPLRLRSVYMMNCWGQQLNQAWLDAGARVASGSIDVNYMPEPTTFFFFRNWKSGQSFNDAVINAYLASVAAFKGMVGTAAAAIPVLGKRVAEHLENLDVVRKSAPRIDGDGTVKLTSDSLSFGSTLHSIAFTVVPLGRESACDAVYGSSLQAIPRTRTLQASEEVVEFIKSFEGFSARLYDDPAGHCTIGYGALVHRGNCNGDPSEAPYAGGITEARAVELLRERLHAFERTVNEGVQTELSQSQFDALVSFSFNVGGGAFLGSTLLRKLNSGDYEAVPGELMRWTKANGKELPGLVRRRRAEAEMFSRGDYGTGQSLHPAQRSSPQSRSAYSAARAHVLELRVADAETEEGEMEDLGPATVQMSVSVPAFCPLNEAEDASSPHFSLSEFHSKDGTEVPRAVRGNIQTLMDQLEVLRAELGAPIQISSGYRSPAHNEKVGGKPQSRHLCGMAADIRVRGFTPQEVHAKLEALIAAGRILQGGLGLYASFVHYDTRGTRARW